MSVHNSLIRLENDTNRISFQRGRESLGSDRLDKHAFMQLLMAQLKYQNPLDPVKDNQFMAQQAQLTQVEKLDDLLTYMKSGSLIAQASGLIGKTVDVKDENGFVYTGMVDSASLSNGDAGLSINGQTYTLNQIIRIHGDPS